MKFYKCSKCGYIGDYYDFYGESYDRETREETSYLECPKCKTPITADMLMIYAKNSQMVDDYFKDREP